MTGIEVKEWREARDISQKRLAKLLPMSLPTLQGWERAEPRGAPPPFMRRALGDLERELGLGYSARPRGLVLGEQIPEVDLSGGSGTPHTELAEAELDPWTDEGAPDEPVREPYYELDDEQPTETASDFNPRTHAGRRAAK